MKPTTHNDQSEAQAESARRRRFRIGKRPLDDDMQRIDGMVQAMDELALGLPMTPAPVETVDAASAEAARAALHDLEQRIELPATAVPNYAQSIEAHSVLPIASQVVTPPPAMTQAELRVDTAPAPAQHLESVAPPSTQTAPPQRRTGMLVDVNRIIQTLEEEAESARHRIDIELRNAREEADEIVRDANDGADRIRDHAQQQARVLLGEVEEIISEAQHTGQEILRKAEIDADSIRQQALVTLDQAQDEARNIVDIARREGEAILAEQRRLATVRAQEALREQDRLKDQIRRLEERRRQVLESLEAQITQLTQLIPGGSDARNVVEFPGGHALG